MCIDLRNDARQAGFTLVELMAVVSILSIVLALAAPSFTAFSASQRLRGASTDLVITLLAARSEAIKRNAEVTVSAAVDGDSANWGRGWTATAPGGLQIDRREVAAGFIDGPASPAAIVFDGSGRMTAAGGVRIQLSDGGGHAEVAPRCISIDLSGRPRTTVGACS
jgi:type IV fimbrial biogenesis protein FimT